MPFTTPLVVRQLDPYTWTLAAPLSYQGSVDHWTVPSGTVTDFASVPRWLQSLVQATGTWTLAAVLHDWFCRGLAAGDCPISPRDADGVFRRILREEGVGFAKRWAMFTAVRWGALANPARRACWWRDAPAVLAISTAVLACAALVTWGADAAVHSLINLIP